MSGNHLIAQDTRYMVYKTGITLADQPDDQPVVYGGDSQYLGILVYNPAGVNAKIEKNTVVKLSGVIERITTGANVDVYLGGEHTLRAGESITISNSDSTPSIDGTYVINSVTKTTVNITPASSVTKEGRHGLWEGPDRVFVTNDVTISGSEELIADHSGGHFKIRITNPPGPYAQPIDIFYRRI